MKRKEESIMMMTNDYDGKRGSINDDDTEER